MMYQKYYFTFGCHHALSDFVQPIAAPSMKSAMAKMFELHGRDWGLDYTSEEYNQQVLNGELPPKEELKAVIV